MDAIKTTDASGGGEKRYSVPALDHVRRIQALGAAISLRNWQGVEQAHAAIRDAFDRPDIYDPHYVAALASAPPAPIPDAGSDLAKLSATAPKGEWHPDFYDAHDEDGGPTEMVCEGIVSYDDDDDAGQIATCNERVAEFICAVVNAFRSGRLIEASVSPPPGEDLAGQGEPAAWAYEYEASDGWQRALWWDDPSNISDGRKRVVRNIRPLYAAPAPYRPADREEIEAAAFAFLNRKYVQRSDARQKSMGLQYMEAETHDLAKEMTRFFLALRDAPRDAGDGWVLIPEHPLPEMMGAFWRTKNTGTTEIGGAHEDSSDVAAFRAYAAAAPKREGAR